MTSADQLSERAVAKARQLNTVATFIPELDLWVVASESQPGLMYQVTVLDNGHVHCTCPAGQHCTSADQLTCYHAAAVVLKITGK